MDKQVIKGTGVYDARLSKKEQVIGGSGIGFTCKRPKNVV